MDGRSGVLAVALGGVLVLGLGGVAVLGGPDDAGTTQVAVTPKVTSKTPATKAPPAPGSLAAYALAADEVCRGAFAASKPVDLDRQAISQVLADRTVSAALEVRTASQLLALTRPADPKAARVPIVLSAHRAAFAAVYSAAKADGRRDISARAKALVAVEGRPKKTSVPAGAVFLGLGSKQCAAWLNPALLRDTGAD